MSEPERTADGRYVVVDGRRWRAQDPALPEDAAAALRSYLGRARSEVGRARRAGDDEAVRSARRRVDRAKRGLGERGEPWWEQDESTRRTRWTAALDDLAVLDPGTP